MVNTRYFAFGKKETEFLTSKDSALGEVMEKIGPIGREIIPDMFMALANSIIGQQISAKAHMTIWQRFQDMFSPVTPEHILSLSAETIQTCGISFKKAFYIKEIATEIVNKNLDLEKLRTMSDEDVCTRLSQLKGIGTWTAEMLMIFSMQRQDVLSWDDLGIQRGLRMLHRHRKIMRDLFVKYKKRYSPYATVASLYLWEIAAGRCEGLVDLAPKKNTKKKAGAEKKPKRPASTANKK